MKQKRRDSDAKERENTEKRPLSERLGTFLDVPADLLCGGCYMELRGRNNLRLQGCRSILVYTETEIVLRLRRGAVRVRGRRLVCTSYHEGSVEIDGRIDGVDFTDGDVGTLDGSEASE